MSNTVPDAPICAQCEANAKSNEAGGYHKLAQECRDYCRRGHRPLPDAPPPERICISGENDGDPNYYVEGTQPELGIEYVRAYITARSEGEARFPSFDWRTMSRLSDDERYRWRKAFNEYCFNHCNHAHEAIPNNLACIGCVFECFTYLSASAPPADEVERALRELREMFPDRSVFIMYADQDYSNDHSHREQYVKISIHAVIDKARPTLTDAMQSVREWRNKEKS